MVLRMRLFDISVCSRCRNNFISSVFDKLQVDSVTVDVMWFEFIIYSHLIANLSSLTLLELFTENLIC